MYTDAEKDEIRVKAQEYVRLLIEEFKKVKQGERNAERVQYTQEEASRLEAEEAQGYVGKAKA